MSIEIVLIPVAIAAVSAWKARAATDDAGRHVVAVDTRMRNEALLVQALADTGASIDRDAETITAHWPNQRGTFAKDPNGIWSVHFPDDTTIETATSLITDVDAAYGRRVQQEVLVRLRERAPGAGMDVESETIEDDDSVTLVLSVHGNT